MESGSSLLSSSAGGADEELLPASLSFVSLIACLIVSAPCSTPAFPTLAFSFVQSSVLFVVNGLLFIFTRYVGVGGRIVSE